MIELGFIFLILKHLDAANQDAQFSQTKQAFDFGWIA